MGGLILNEAAVKQMGLKHPVEKSSTIKAPSLPMFPHVVVGVIKDMVMESPYKKPDPVMFFCGVWANHMFLRVNPRIPMREALAKIEPVFKKYNPGSPFDFRFNDDTYAKKFSEEERIGRLGRFLCGAGDFISCLGLFGLASFHGRATCQGESEFARCWAPRFSIFGGCCQPDFVALVILSCLYRYTDCVVLSSCVAAEV